MNFVRTTVLSLMFAGLMLVPAASHAQTQSISDMLALIQKLTTQIQELQKQLSTVRGDIKGMLKDDLREGMSDEDIKKIQEILASDPEIYPEGMTTGYFGPLTKRAIMRLEERHGLKPTGEISSTTKALLEKYLEEGFGEKIPPGLLRAPGIIKKVELNLCSNSGKGKATGPLCKKYHSDDDNDDANDDEGEDMDDDDEQEDDDDHALELESVNVSDRHTTVKFSHDDETHRVRVNSTKLSAVLVKIAGRLDMDVADLDEDFVDDIETELADALDEASRVDYEIEDITVSMNNVRIEFEYDGDDYEVKESALNSVDSILDDVADEINEDLEDLDENFVEELTEMLEDFLGFSDVEVEVDDNTTTVTFTHFDTEYEVEVASTDADAVVDALSDELNVAVDDLDEDFINEVLELLDDAS